jgi:hypothetical protein
MARKIVHQLVDDLDGSLLEVGEGETVLFSLDGAAYEVDLTSEHAAELRRTLEPYIAAGRRVGSARPGPSARAARGPGAHRDYAPIREWAKQNGYAVSERGRVPAAVLEAYDAAH